MALGAVQLLIIGFDQRNYLHEQIRREIDGLQGRGLIRIIDARVIVKEQDGSISTPEALQFLIDGHLESGQIIGLLIGVGDNYARETVDTSDLDTPDFAQREFGIGQRDIKAIVHDLEPNTGAVLLLIQHDWALRLKEATFALGSALIAHGFLTAEALVTVGAPLNVAVEAEAAIALTNALAGAVLLNALETVADAEQGAGRADPDAHSVAERDRVVAVSTGVAVLKALIVAGLIDDATVGEAVDVLTSIGMIPVAITERAMQYATQQAHATEAAIAAIETTSEHTYEE